VHTLVLTFNGFKMACYYWLLVNILLVNPSLCYKFLCLLPYPGKSHYDVFAPLLDELSERGHQLTVVSFFPLHKPQPNRRDVSLVGITPLNVEVVNISQFDSYFGLARYVEHIPVSTYLATSQLQLCEKLLENDLFQEFLNAEGDYDVILVEHFNSDCMLGLVHNYQLPSIGLMSCAFLPFSYQRVGAPDNPSYVPGMTLPFTDEMTFSQRVENFIVLFFYNIWYEIRIRWKEQKILEAKLGKKLPPLADVAKNTSVVLVNTHYSLNGVRVLPPSVVEVGGIHLHNHISQPLPEVKSYFVSYRE
jgi:glucuronosyltransferase